MVDQTDRPIGALLYPSSNKTFIFLANSNNLKGFFIIKSTFNAFEADEINRDNLSNKD